MSVPPPLSVSQQTLNAIDLAIAEDIGTGDVTAHATIDSHTVGNAFLLMKDTAQDGVTICGQAILPTVLARVDPQLSFTATCDDGTKLHRGDRFGKISGPLRSILAAERVCLNLLQRCSGIATFTSQFVSAVAGTGVKILDTRKTDPCWRELHKYAVTIGGGKNHRIGLFDMFLIKNNHIDGLGGDVALAIRRCREYRPQLKIEVEVRDITELTAALTEKPDIILLDNFSVTELPAAIAQTRSHPQGKGILLEYSGGATLETVRQIAETGVDYISVGALTHSYPNIDISLRVERV